jgi:DNA-binding response OmpR family regulator
MAPTVLVIEDEAMLRDLLRSYFEREGVIVLSTGSGADGVALARESHPDIVILDLGLPDVAGEDILEEMHRLADIPVLVLTGRASESDRVRGLELGADDYLTKPFSPRELVLRTQAILRRGRGIAHVDERVSFGQGELILDESRHEVLVGGELVDLTPTEWGLLQALATTPGRVYSRLELINRVRGYEYEGYERTIDSHVKNLRRKIEHVPASARSIETVLGHGYRLRLPRDN